MWPALGGVLLQVDCRNTGGTRFLHTGSNQSDANHIVQGGIDDRAEGNVRRVIDSAANKFSHLVDLKKRHIFAAADIEEYTLRPANRHVEKTARDCFLGGTLRAVAPLSLADAHEGGSSFTQHAAHIGEIDVHQPGNVDDLGDTLHALAQHVIRYFEGISKTAIAPSDCQQAVIRHGNQRVNLST